MIAIHLIVDRYITNFQRREEYFYQIEVSLLSRTWMSIANRLNITWVSCGNDNRYENWRLIIFLSSLFRSTSFGGSYPARFFLRADAGPGFPFGVSGSHKCDPSTPKGWLALTVQRVDIIIYYS